MWQSWSRPTVVSNLRNCWPSRKPTLKCQRSHSVWAWNTMHPIFIRETLQLLTANVPTGGQKSEEMKYAGYKTKDISTVQCSHIIHILIHVFPKVTTPHKVTRVKNPPTCTTWQTCGRAERGWDDSDSLPVYAPFDSSTPFCVCQRQHIYPIAVINYILITISPMT